MVEITYKILLCAISLMPSINSNKENSFYSVNFVFPRTTEKEFSINNIQIAKFERLQINSKCHQHKPVGKALIRSIIDSNGGSYLIRMETTGRRNGDL